MNYYYTDLDIKLAFSASKVGHFFNMKDSVTQGLYIFLCAGCNDSYIGDTTRHFSTRVRVHLVSDKASHVYKHIASSQACTVLFYVMFHYP